MPAATGPRRTKWKLALREYLDVLVGMAYESWGQRASRFDRAHRRVWDFNTAGNLERFSTVIATAARHLPVEKWKSVLEVGCAKGVFTEMLAGHCHLLTACDVSQVACDAAAQRCAAWPNVRIQRVDLVREQLLGQYNVVFALDLLEALHGRSRIATAIDKMAAALAPGGLLVYSGSRLPAPMRQDVWTRWLPEGADLHVRILEEHKDLQLMNIAEFNGTAESAIPPHLLAVLARKTADRERAWR